MDIHTDLNVADDPSRGTPINDERAKQTIAVLKGANGRPEHLRKSGSKLSEYTKLIQEIQATSISDKNDSLWSDIQLSRRKLSSESDTRCAITKRPHDHE